MKRELTPSGKLQGGLVNITQTREIMKEKTLDKETIEERGKSEGKKQLKTSKGLNQQLQDRQGAAV